MHAAPRNSWRLRCERCGHEEPLGLAHWRCPVDGGAFELRGPNRINRADLLEDRTIWRYAQVLPVERGSSPSLGAGWTPLVEGHLRGRRVWFKLDALLPSGSFKDRGAALVAAFVRAYGGRRIIVDSSGNAAAATAAYAAASGIECTVYCPASASPAKLIQSRAHGASVVIVEGPRAEATRAAVAAAEADPSSYYGGHNWNPVFVEGVKTWAMETWEQLGSRSPVAAFIPTGGGSAYVGARRGFEAISTSLPMLIAAQPAACAPIAQTASSAEDVMPVTPQPTMAEGASIADPPRGRAILRAMRASGGWATAVSEADIELALRDLWRQGLYVEPTAALGAAGCLSAIAAGRLPAEGDIVVLLTGSGLKATERIGALLGTQLRSAPLERT